MNETNTRTDVPVIRVDETDQEYAIVFEIPGVAKENVDLHADGKTLVLRTNAAPEATPAGYRSAIREFTRVNYAASVELPERADPNAIRATVANGLLTATIGKRVEAVPRKIAIS